MKLKIIVLIFVSFTLMAMQQPRGKRAAEEPIEQLQGEPKTQRDEPGMEVETISVSPGTQVTAAMLAGVPQTVRDQIFSYLLSAQGATNQIQLINATQNIRNYLMALNSDRRFRGILDNPTLADQIIKELAKRYTNNNLVLAAQALATDAASKWVAQNIIRNENILKDWRKAILTAVKELNDISAFRFLTDNISKDNQNLITAIADIDGHSLLFNAVKNDNAAIIYDLIAKRANIESIDAPLILAVKEYKLKAAQALLEKGANVNKYIKDPTLETGPIKLFDYALYRPYAKRMENEDPYALVKLFITTQLSGINPSLRTDINARIFDNNTKTLLGHIKSIAWALQQKGLDNFIQFLIEHGAKE